MTMTETGAALSPRYGRDVQALGTGRIGMIPTRLAAFLLIIALVPLAGRAQAPLEEVPSAASFDEVQATIRRMQERLERLGTAASERDQALRFLEEQVEQATGEITGTGETNAALHGETAALADRLEDLSRDRDQLEGEVGQRGEALAALEQRVGALSDELSRAQGARTLLAAEVDTLRASLAAAAAREGELTTEIAALRGTLGEGAAALAERAAEAENLRLELAAVRQGADEAARRAAREVAAAEGAAEALRRERESLRVEVAELNALLAAAETKVDEQQDRIDGLDERLAAALSARVAELEQYRSEFFGRLRRALGDRPELRVVGDRFVLQSELLFASGSAELDAQGAAQLRALAQTLKDVAARIPPEVDWILGVDGHTDRRPVRDGTYRSNWELSTARAISVVRFLIGQGIPPHHLAATGFGEYRPIDAGDDEIAYRRNRRIELKLTEG